MADGDAGTEKPDPPDQDLANARELVRVAVATIARRLLNREEVHPNEVVGAQRAELLLDRRVELGKLRELTRRPGGHIPAPALEVIDGAGQEAEGDGGQASGGEPRKAKAAGRGRGRGKASGTKRAGRSKAAGAAKPRS